MKKRWSNVLILSLITGLLAACSSNGGSNSSTAGSTQSPPSNTGKEQSAGEGKSEVVNFTIPVLPDDLEAFQTVYKEFEKEYPNIKIEFITFPAGQFYYEKLRIQLSGGVEYDLFGGVLDSLVDTGIIEPLDELIKANNMDVSGFGEMFEGMKINGKSYGLPYRKSNWMLYYNKDLFDQANVPYPDEDMTWDEFRATAKQLTSGSGQDKIYGAYLHQWAQTWYMPAVQGGTTIIDKDMEPFRDALQFRLDLEKDGSIMKWSEQITTGAHYNAAFQKGNVAMNLMGDWHVAQLRQAEAEGKISFDWDIAPLPHPEGVESNTTLELPVALMINKNSKHKEEAFKVVEFMTGSKGAEIFAKQGYLTGFTNDAVREAYSGDGTLKPEHINYFNDAKAVPEYPMLPGVKNIIVNGIFKQEGELVFVGEQTPEEAVAKIAERVAKEWGGIYADQFSIDK
ncbi:ABC transporter substrate-binding protein [Paenibacillus agaridevorans]|uniref:ABC transporter substrate-binding protein n=1 Tax=Paenibacillus agaridevorans TaxID=171404 RepID=UPI001BE4A092|nr:sugar ABC transporter substrate-binding protein [Paenibacillus agaridevorans]